MKCESCGNELIGAAIICRACNHNNALPMRLARRRAEPRHNQSAQPRASGPLVELPTIATRKDADVNLIHFPSASTKQTAPMRQTAAESDPETTSYPPWRAELKERVRQIKEKRSTGKRAASKPAPVQESRPQAAEAKPDRKPIVESALNRLRRAPQETERQGDRETGRQRDRETGRQGDRETGRQRDFSQSPSAPPPLHPSVPPSLHPPVSSSPRRPVAPPPRRPVAPSLHPAVSPPRVEHQTSTNKPSLSGPLASAAYKHVETRVIEIAQVHEEPGPIAKPAPLYARALAGVCDIEIVFAAFLLVFGAYSASSNDTSSNDESRLVAAVLLPAVVFIYQIVMLAFAGRTFGMALLKLNLVNTADESRPVTLLQKMLRALAATVVFICFPLYLTAGFSASRRTLPDLISGTTVLGLRIEDRK